MTDLEFKREVGLGNWKISRSEIKFLKKRFNGQLLGVKEWVAKCAVIELLIGRTWQKTVN